MPKDLLADLNTKTNEVYNRLTSAEMLGQKDLWIRTKHIPKKGSSAYGPVQMTREFARSAIKNKFFEKDKELKKWVQTKFIPHADLLLHHGTNPYWKTPKPKDYNPIYEYGGGGDYAEQDKIMYEKMAKTVIREELRKNPNIDMPKYWHSNPNKAYRERYDLPMVK